ncbi:MAG: hydroxylamine reductase [Spirochaetaceae bacterium]|nr:MAG: hydroxylamine reductase [Spirochaetaceae bacterium]
MNMFCFQCQETARNEGCTVRGVCGKGPATAALQDLLTFVVKGIAFYADLGAQHGASINEAGLFCLQALFATITNANFDDRRFEELIERGLELRDQLADRLSGELPSRIPPAASWHGTPAEYLEHAARVGVLSTEDEDVRSLRETIVYGLRGIAAYGDHAAVLGREDATIYRDLVRLLAATTDDEKTVDDLVALVLETGELAYRTMALLDAANTGAYGNPQISTVNIGVGSKPGILISGHDLRDLEELLQQTEGSGVDVYTHCEMLPAHYYPAFKKYRHFVGNYGNSWWKQDKEFESFNGAILMTTNCITPVRDVYRDRIFTTGMAGYPGVPHIADRTNDSAKDFGTVIERASRCASPTELETGSIVGGFAHAQAAALSDAMADAVRNGAIRRLVVMSGCDGRQRGRSYFSEVAEQLPDDTLILTSGCAKYRYNKLNLGEINGIPRVLDAGQCNDSYSLAVIALRLKDDLGIENINDLPLSFDLAWYEQKAVCVLLALLWLGVRNIRLGPTLPAFLSPAVVKVITRQFNLMPTADAGSDVAAMLAE